MLSSRPFSIWSEWLTIIFDWNGRQCGKMHKKCENEVEKRCGKWGDCKFSQKNWKTTTKANERVKCVRLLNEKLENKYVLQKNKKREEKKGKTGSGKNIIYMKNCADTTVKIHYHGNTINATATTTTSNQYYLSF